MSESTGLFGRLKRIISGTLNQAVEAVSDPGQEVALLLDDLAAQIKQSERDLQQIAVDRKVLEKKREELRKEATLMMGRAEQALRANNEGLARAALEVKNKHELELAGVEASLADQTAIFEKMKVELEAARAKHKSLNLRRGTLMGQARAQKQAEKAGGMAGPGGATMAAIEDKIAQIEAHNEVAAEFQAEKRQEAAVAAQFAALDGKVGLDDELTRLKAKLAAANPAALPAGPTKEKLTLRLRSEYGWALLCAWLFVAAHPYFETIRSANEIPRVLQGLGWLAGHDGALDAWAQQGIALGPDVARSPATGQLYPNKPPGATLVALPALATARALASVEEPLTLARATWWTRLGAALVPTILGLIGLAWWTRRAHGAKDLAIAAVLLASPWAAYTKLAYGHVLSGIMVSAGVACVLHERRTGLKRYVGFGTALLGLSVAVEYMLALFLAPWLVWQGLQAVRDKAWARLGWALVGGGGGASVVLMYNHQIFGSAWSTGYHSMVTADLAAKHQQGILGLVGPNAESLWHTWLNPACGVVWWIPWFAFAWRGWWLARRDETARAWIDACACIVATAALVVSSLDFQGGWRVGPRYLVPILPLLSTGVYALWQHETMRGWRLACVAALAAGMVVNLPIATLWPHVDTQHVASPLIEIVWPLLQDGVHPLGIAHTWPHGLWMAAVVLLPFVVLAAVVLRAEQRALSPAPRWVPWSLAVGWIVAVLAFACVPTHRDGPRNLNYIRKVYAQEDEPSRVLPVVMQKHNASGKTAGLP